MSVKVGQVILAKDEKRKLIVNEVIPTHLSGDFSFDFSGIYVEPAGVIDGSFVYGGRCFSYKCDNWENVSQ